MTIEQFNKIPFHMVSHIMLKKQHITNYVCDGGQFAFHAITPVLKNGDFGTPRKYYRIGTKWYKSKEAFLEALEAL